MTLRRRWNLIGPNGKPFESSQPGTLGGHRSGKIYGELDCRSALRAIARGGYVRNRVFFLNEETAVLAGYRPCSVCLPAQYALWRARRDHESAESSGTLQRYHDATVR